MDENLNPLRYSTDSTEGSSAQKLERSSIPVSKKKKSIWKKGVGLIISEDANTIGGYIMNGVVLPAVNRVMHDSMVGTADILFGNQGKTKASRAGSFIPSKSSYEYDNTDYAGAYRRNERPSAKEVTDKYRGKIDVEDLIFATKAEAEEILGILSDRAEECSYVMVQDLYDLLDIGSAPSISTKWGWTSLENARIRSCREGWLLEMPPVVPLKN